MTTEHPDRSVTSRAANARSTASARTAASGPRSAESSWSGGDAREQLRTIGERLDPFMPPELRTPVRDGRPASVLILFSPVPSRLDSAVTVTDSGTRPQASEPLRAADLSVLLQVRASTLREHAGQVSFPGGRREPGDTDAVQTALREASEETGLDAASVQVLATLPTVPLAVSNHSVTPVLGWWASPRPLIPVDHAETTRVWQAPVAQLLEPSTRFTAVVHHDGRDWGSPAFDVDGTIVWGFTGILLDRLFENVGWARPWDASRTRPIAP
jgi:8-oxo-dGTP pyrophosphatase MutT (NUDIX family)